MDTKDLIAGLAARAEQLGPPTAGKIRISTVRAADARIRELETALNIPRGKFISHIRKPTDGCLPWNPCLHRAPPQ